MRRVDVPNLGRRTDLLGCCAFASGDPAPPRPVFRVANLRREDFDHDRAGVGRMLRATNTTKITIPNICM